MPNVPRLLSAHPLLGLTLLSLLAHPASAQRTTVTVSVAGTSNPWLASGTSDGADMAPDESAASVSGLSVSAGGVFTFAATGAVGYQSGVEDPPNGEPGFVIDHDGGPANGISDVFAPADALMGVFLGSGPADPSLTPNALDFSTVASQDVASRTPLLQQVFFIGSGVTSTGAVKQFVAPSQSARLFLGTMDGGGWYNNPGAFSVRVTGPAAAPEPSAIVALALGVSGLAVLALKKRMRHCR